MIASMLCLVVSKFLGFWLYGAKVEIGGKSASTVVVLRDCFFVRGLMFSGVSCVTSPIIRLRRIVSLSYEEREKRREPFGRLSIFEGRRIVFIVSGEISFPSLSTNEVEINSAMLLVDASR